MQIVITGRHLEVTEPIKRYVEERIARFEAYAYDVLKVHVILSVEKFRHIVEVTLWTKHHNITSKDETHDIYTSVDGAVNKVENQLIRYHDKLKEQKRELKDKRTEFKKSESPQSAGEEFGA